MKAPPQKRGRKKKGEVSPEIALNPKELPALSRSVQMRPGQILKALHQECDWGCKKNSQGKGKTWKGFNLHVLSADGEIPLACVLIGASVHYSQSAPAYEGADKMRIIVRPGHVGVLMPSGLVFVSEKGVIVQIYGEPLDRAIREREDKKKFSMWD